MSPWQRPCIICRRARPLAFCKRLAPFGVLGFCERCQRAVLEALLEASDPHSLSEVFALLRAGDVERRESATSCQLSVVSGDKDAGRGEP